MHEVVALMDVPDVEHMLLQNLQIVCSSQCTVLGEEEKTTSTVISTENTPYHYTLRVFHCIAMDLESYLDDPGDILTNLDPPLTSLNLLCLNLLQFSSLQMSNAELSLQIWTLLFIIVKLWGASYLHSVMTDSGLSGDSAELSWWICRVKSWAASFSS